MQQGREGLIQLTAFQQVLQEAEIWLTQYGLNILAKLTIRTTTPEMLDQISFSLPKLWRACLILGQAAVPPWLHPPLDLVQGKKPDEAILWVKGSPSSKRKLSSQATEGETWEEANNQSKINYPKGKETALGLVHCEVQYCKGNNAQAFLKG